MARKLFERQGIRLRGGALATGVVFVAYTDEAATVLADISATSGGSAIPGSSFTVAAVAGLGPASFRIWGPTDDTAVLYLRCPADPGLGVQEIEAEPEAGAAGVTDHGALTGLADDDHPQYATDTDLSTHAAAANPHSVYALDTDLATHEADTTAIHGITDTSALATSSSVTSAVSTHAGLTDPHTGYVLESLYDAKGDLLAGSADNTPAKLTAGANGTLLTPDSGQAAGLKYVTVTEAGAVTTTGGGKETVQAHGATGSTETFDLASGNVHSATLDTACTFTFTAPTNSVACSMTLLLTQDATGSRVVTWPASVKWASGSAPTLSTGAGKVDALTFLTIDGGTTWYGFASGLDLR